MRDWLCMTLLIITGCGRPAMDTAMSASSPAQLEGMPSVDIPPSPQTAPTQKTAPSISPSPKIPGIVLRAKEPTPIDLHPQKALTLDIRNVVSMRLSPEGNVIGAMGEGREKLTSPVQVMSAFYNLNTGKQIGPPNPFNGPGDLSNKGTTTAYLNFQSFNSDSDVVVREIATGKESIVTKVKSRFELYAFSHDGRLIVTGCNTELKFIRIPECTIAFPTVKTATPILDMSSIYLGGTRIATLHDGGEIVIWDLSSGKRCDEVKLNRPKQTHEILLIAEDGRSMIVNNEKEELQPWDLHTKTRLEWSGCSSCGFRARS